MTKSKNSDKNEYMVVANSKTLGEFLLNIGKLIKIPPNQRPYSWGKDQVKDFLEDLENTRRNKNNSHFFNVIAYTRENEEIQIQEGQQRITTCFLTLLILYKMMQKAIEDARDSNITDINSLNEYKEKVDLWRKNIYYSQNDKSKKKLTMYGENEEYLKEILEMNFNDKNSFDTEYEKLELNETISNKRIKETIKYIIEFIEKTHGNEFKNNKLFLLEEYFVALITRFQIISSEIKNYDERYKIFELVNSRGIALNEFDKTKNFMYQVASKSDKKYEDNKELLVIIENTMKTIFETLGDDAEGAFALHWTMFFNKKATKNDGYGLVKRKDFSKLYESFKYGIEYGNNKRNPNAEKNGPKTQADKVYNFLKDLKDNIDKIKKVFQFFNLDISEDINPCTLQGIKKNLDTKEIYRLFVYYQITMKAGFEYIENILYFIMLKHLASEGEFNITTEFKKVIAYYGAKTIMETSKSKLEVLNNSLGPKLREKWGENGDGFNINEIFAEYDKKRVGNDDFFKSTFENVEKKITKHDRSFKTNLTKLVFLFIYDKKIEDGDDLYNKFFPKSNNNKRNIIEEEHIYPMAMAKENEKAKFILNYLGNKLILCKNKNTEVGASLYDKFKYYISQKEDDIILNYCLVAMCTIDQKTYGEWTIKELIEYLDKEGNKGTMSELFKINNDTDYNIAENYAKIEQAWRKKIGNWFGDSKRDLLGINDLQAKIDELKDASKENNVKKK
ncbi:MAG: DUF262 domain-containing protein [Bacilli bacterium]